MKLLQPQNDLRRVELGACQIELLCSLQDVVKLSSWDELLDEIDPVHILDTSECLDKIV